MSSYSAYKLRLAINAMRARLDEIERLIDLRDGVARVVKKAKKKKAVKKKAKKMRVKRKAVRKVAKKTVRKVKRMKVRLSAKGRIAAAKAREAKKRAKRRGDPRQIDIEDLLRPGASRARYAKAP